MPFGVIDFAWTSYPMPSAATSSDQTLRRDLVALLPRLRRFALSLTRNAADADDLVQDACLRAMSRAADWDAAQGLDRWVFRILRNAFISDTRRARTRQGQGQVDATEATELRTHITGEHDLAATQIMGRLAALPAGYAATLLLVAVEGYSYAEAAELLSIPPGTVMSRVSRARQMLAERLADQTADGGAVS